MTAGENKLPVSQTNWQKLMKLYIQLHLNMNYYELYFGAYCSRSSDARNLFLKQWYNTKLRKIVPNTNYFKLIIFEFKTFIIAVVR